MRAYIMHHYGGGFTNFNETHFPWLSYLNNSKMILLKYGYMDIQSKTLKHLLATSNMEVFLALKYSSITLNSLEPITTSLERIPNLLPIG